MNAGPRNGRTARQPRRRPARTTRAALTVDASRFATDEPPGLPMLWLTMLPSRSSAEETAATCQQRPNSRFDYLARHCAAREAVLPSPGGSAPDRRRRAQRGALVERAVSVLA